MHNKSPTRDKLIRELRRHSLSARQLAPWQVRLICHKTSHSETLCVQSHWGWTCGEMCRRWNVLRTHRVHCQTLRCSLSHTTDDSLLTSHQHANTGGSFSGVLVWQTLWVGLGLSNSTSQRKCEPGAAMFHHLKQRVSHDCITYWPMHSTGSELETVEISARLVKCLWRI